MRMLERSQFVTDDVDAVARVLKRASGITFNRGLAGTLNAAYHAASADLGIDPATCLRRLNAGEPEAVAALVERAVVSETYFFRHADHFQLLTSWMIGALMHPSPLRIWSAGCATGEEAYSAAIALLTAGRLGDQIVATDISRSALARAQEARFAAWSFRRMDPQVRARFFEEQGGAWRLNGSVRRAVQFSQHNLVTEPPPANNFHIVFCRNVLIYFEGEQLRKVLQGLVSALVPGGFLVVAVPELPLISELPLERVEHQGVVVYRKVDQVRAAAPKPAPPSSLPLPRRAPATAPRTTPTLKLRKAQVAPPLPTPAPAAPSESLYEQAREAARSGDLATAEKLAGQVAQTQLLPEAWLLLAMAAESRRDLQRAIDAVRRALYLDPGLVMGHAMLVALHTKMGASEEADRARRNALRLLDGVHEETLVRAVEPITAGTLRRALGERS